MYPHYYGVHESAQGSVRCSVVATLHHCTAPGRGMAACASAHASACLPPSTCARGNQVEVFFRHAARALSVPQVANSKHVDLTDNAALRPITARAGVSNPSHRLLSRELAQNKEDSTPSFVMTQHISSAEEATETWACGSRSYRNG